MALQFGLSIKTYLRSARVSQILSDKLDIELQFRKIRAEAITIGVIAETALGQSIIEEAFGFRPTISVWFRIAARDNYEKGVLTMLNVTFFLLDKFLGNSVLLFNGEEVICQRINGEFLINQDRSVWKVLQISEITLPYKLVSISSPLL